MSEDDPRGEPSLELPSLRSVLGFRRRRAAPSIRTDPATEEPAQDPVQEPAHDPAHDPAQPAAVPADRESTGSGTDTATTVLPVADRTPRLTEPTSRSRRRRLPRLRRPRAPRVRRPTHVPGPLAALVAGLGAGLVLVGGTWGAMHLCTLLRGTSSCGLPGIGLLLLIVLAAAIVGSLVMRYLGVAAHASAAALGTGLVVVLVLLALLPYDERWWMALVVPALTMATFVTARWLTATYVEPGDGPR